MNEVEGNLCGVGKSLDESVEKIVLKWCGHV